MHIRSASHVCIKPLRHLHTALVRSSSICGCVRSRVCRALRLYCHSKTHASGCQSGGNPISLFAPLVFFFDQIFDAHSRMHWACMCCTHLGGFDRGRRIFVCAQRCCPRLGTDGAGVFAPTRDLPHLASVQGGRMMAKEVRAHARSPFYSLLTLNTSSSSLHEQA